MERVIKRVEDHVQRLIEIVNSDRELMVEVGSTLIRGLVDVQPPVPRECTFVYFVPIGLGQILSGSFDLVKATNSIFVRVQPTRTGNRLGETRVGDVFAFLGFAFANIDIATIAQRMNRSLELKKDVGMPGKEGGCR
jgi:hypothetical protein